MFKIIKEKLRIKKLEKEMRFAMRYFALNLKAGLDFEKTIEKVSMQKTALGKEFSKVSEEIKKGKSVQKALSQFLKNNNSTEIRKTVSALIMCYQKGGDGEILKKTIEEQNTNYRIKLKEYNGKMTMYSLFFIGFGAVAPALMQAVLTIGSAFLDIGIKPITSLIILITVFPGITTGILMWSKWKAP